MFVILGNFMPNIKQNYTFGCRTPWALNDEHNWQSAPSAWAVSPLL